MWGMEISRYHTFNQGEVQSHPSKLTGMILFVINDTIVLKKMHVIFPNHSTVFQQI